MSWHRQPPVATPAGLELRTLLQLVDHFNCVTAGNETFMQRYLLNDAGWSPGGPIFVFTGAEGGDVTGVIGDYGGVLTQAAQLGGMVVAVEGRFFGRSQPAIAVEQMIKDNAALIEWIRADRGAWSSPVVAFGGSLAGTLGALLRLSRPWLVDAAWASSSPLLGWEAQADPFAWRARVTATWEEARPGCAAVVRRGFGGLSRLDPVEVAITYKTCNTAFWGNGAAFRDIVWSKLETHAEFVYEVGLPRLAADCERMEGAVEDSGAIFARFLDTGAGGAGAKCLNLTQPRASEEGEEGAGVPESERGIRQPPGVPPGGEAINGWSYMACTQVIHPIGSNNKTDFFPPYNWSVRGLEPGCRKAWGTEPRPRDLPRRYGLDARSLARSASRILFSYGTKDPWATMGVGFHDLSERLPVVAIDGGSHCADMAYGRPGDSKPMLRARGQQGTILRRWLAEIAQERKQATVPQNALA